MQELWYNNVNKLSGLLSEYTISQQEDLVNFVNPYFHPILFYQEGFLDDSLALEYYKIDDSGKPSWKFYRNQQSRIAFYLN